MQSNNSWHQQAHNLISLIYQIIMQLQYQTTHFLSLTTFSKIYVKALKQLIFVRLISFVLKAVFSLNQVRSDILYIIYINTSQILINCLSFYNFSKLQSGKFSKMINLGFSFNQNDLFDDSDNKICLSNLSYVQDPIDLFLNQDVFLVRGQQIKQIDSFYELSNTHHPIAPSKASQIQETHQHLKKKSIFHNFQKHLITLIKKSTNICQDTHLYNGNNLSSHLWTAFMKTRQFNKKILHTVFGVLQKNKAKEEFSKLSEQFPEFKPIFSQNSAQRVIRERFVEQASNQNKEEVAANSHINRFEQFYEYYQSFVCELKSGPMNKRMTKSIKSNLVSRLQGSTSQN